MKTILVQIQGELVEKDLAAMPHSELVALRLNVLGQLENIRSQLRDASAKHSTGEREFDHVWAATAKRAEGVRRDHVRRMDAELADRCRWEKRERMVAAVAQQADREREFFHVLKRVLRRDMGDERYMALMQSIGDEVDVMAHAKAAE